MITRKAPVARTPSLQGKEPAAAAPAGFEVELACPHCGAPFRASDATVSHTCDHCTSLLIIEAPEREEVFLEPAQVTDQASILETLLRYRIDAHRSSILADHSDEEGNPPTEIFISALLKLFESRLRANARIVDCRLLHVPYRQTSAMIVQATLGRHGDGAKVARLRAYTAEQTSAAYDVAQLNLRDTGLRLGRSVFKPLLSADVAKLGRFVPRSVADASRRELEKWRGQNLEAGFESVAKQGQISVTFEATVYRPYFLVRASLDRGDETLLFDGGFGTIAGYLSDQERERFTRGKEVDPLGTTGASFRRTAIVPARCPNCGADPKLADEAFINVCVNCHAGVAATAQGLALANYEREEGLIPKKEGVLLPFWRFPFSIPNPGAPAITTLDAYTKWIFPQAAPVGFSPQGDRVFVPAWRLLTTEAGDETFADLAHATHSRPWSWTGDRVGLEARPRFAPATLSEEEAKSIAWTSLFAMHTKASAARLNAMLIKQKLFDAKVSFGRGVLTLIAFDSNDHFYTRPEVRIPRLLIDGGPALVGQRVSVHRAASEVATSLKRPSVSARVRTSKYDGGAS